MSVTDAAMLRRVFALVLIAAVVGSNPMAHQRAADRNYSQVITATSVPLNHADPKANRVGAVTVTEIWQLRSANTGFGGFSGMVLLGPRHFLMGSDRGVFAGFTLSAAGQVTRDFIAPLHSGADENGRSAPTDMEAMTSDHASGQIWAAYERRNEIRRFTPGLARLDGYVRPHAMRNWPKRSGPEAMVRLDDGRFLVIAEQAVGPVGGGDALIFPTDPVAHPLQHPLRFSYDPQNWGLITDVAQLPDGRVIILHRRVTPRLQFETVIAVADPATIRANTMWHARFLARFAPPDAADNFEALVVEPGSNPAAIWMMSDDNLTWWQRTLLVRMTIPAPRRAAVDGPMAANTYR